MPDDKTIDKAEAVDAEVWKLLPWLATDELDGEELEKVCEHLKASRLCRQELLFLSELRFVVEMTSSTDEPATPRRFDALMRRIEDHEADKAKRKVGEASESPLRRQAQVSPLHKPPRARRLVWAVAAQAALILLLAGALIERGTSTPRAVPPEAPTFVTLSESPVMGPEKLGSDPRLRLIFEPEAAEAEIRKILLDLDGTLVDGPTRIGAYTVAIAPETSVAEALKGLQSNPHIAFAEEATPP